MSAPYLDFDVDGSINDVTTVRPISSQLVDDLGCVNGAFILDDHVGNNTETAQGNSRESTGLKNKPDFLGNYGSTHPPSEHGSRQQLTSGTTPHVYKYRWIILCLFCLYSFSNAFQWIHLNIIADVLVSYYNESLPDDIYQRNNAIDWLSMVYMLAYIPLIFPAAWLLDKRGLRFCCIWGTFFNALGAWLKCASVAPDRFGVLMFAQTICAVAQVSVLGIPARLAAVWFGPNEVSSATSLGVFGNQVGIAVGFLLPPIIVPSSNSSDTIGENFGVMCYSTAGFTTLVFLLIVAFFRSKPPQPPSRAQQLAVEAAANEVYLNSLTRLFKNKGFVILMVAYGINTGSFYALSTLLNAIVLYYFPGDGENAGRIGLTIVLMGVAGSVLAGIWLDKTKTYKGTTTAVYILSLAGAAAFTSTLNLNAVWVVFVTAGSLGFFMTGYLPVGFEFAAELTFPESEGTSSGMLNASAQVFGIAFTLGMRAMLTSISVLSANITICASLLVGCIVTAIIKPDYRRQKAGKAVAEVFFKENEITVGGATEGSHARNVKTDLPERTNGNVVFSIME